MIFALSKNTGRSSYPFSDLCNLILDSEIKHFQIRETTGIQVMGMFPIDWTGGGEGHLPTHPKKEKSLLHLESLFRTVFTCLRLAAFTEIEIKNWAYYM